MVRSIDRRSFLAAGATAGVVTIAGCGQDSGATETENTEAGTDESNTSDGNNGSTGSASFDLDVTVDDLEFPDAFESLSVEFTGFKLLDVGDSTVTRESDPVQFDLAELASSGESVDLIETTVPAGEYPSINYFITATDSTMSSGDGEQTFNDGEILGVSGGLTIKASDSITFTPYLLVSEGFENDWRIGTGITPSEDIERQS